MTTGGWGAGAPNIFGLELDDQLATQYVRDVVVRFGRCQPYIISDLKWSKATGTINSIGLHSLHNDDPERSTSPTLHPTQP